MFFLILASLLPYVTSQTFPTRQNYSYPDRVYAGMPEFPSRDAFYELAASLDGEVITPTSEGYINASKVWNFRMQRLPEVIFQVESVEDIQKVILFAKRYNLMVTIFSSGHSFLGRSSHDGSMQIDLRRMKKRTFNLNSDRSPAGEVTVESGNSWIEVYKAVDEQVTQDAVGNVVRRVIVGGSAHTVAMGGYTQGGGHSPISRSLGLVVDSLLEATVVLADGRKAVVNAQGTIITDLQGQTTTSNDTSLFWALRGGGGGTWGVVTDFTFKLHYAPQRFRKVTTAWALTYMGMDIGSDILRFVIQQLAGMSPNWGGYFLFSGAPLVPGVAGSLTLALNHFGSEDDPSNNEVNPLLHHNGTGNQYSLSDERMDTFLDYEVTAVDAAEGNTYLFGTFIQPEIAKNSTQLDALVKFLMNLITAAPQDSLYACTGILIGGKMGDVAEGETPINPKYRSGLMAFGCGLSWAPHKSHSDEFYINHALQKRDELTQLGEGTYFNECAEDLDDWKTAYWGTGDNYNRLLEAKRKWDPDMFFWCHNCVGSDLVSGQK